MVFGIHSGRQAPGIDSPEVSSGSAVGGAIALVLAQPDDESFLFAVYASTRAEEVALTGWLPSQQEQFLRMQFEAQTRSYRMQFPQAKHWVIRYGEVTAGRMIVDRTPDEILLIDIALLPEHRGNGIGSQLMGNLIEEAGQDGKAIRIHVERFNPALLWYQRLGFKTVSESEIYLEMVWRQSAGEAGE
jgi:ribosomal protein S18 acetylase RimI-like enzyme